MLHFLIGKKWLRSIPVALALYALIAWSSTPADGLRVLVTFILGSWGWAIESAYQDFEKQRGIK